MIELQAKLDVKKDSNATTTTTTASEPTQVKGKRKAET